MGQRHHTCNVTSNAGTKGGTTTGDTPLALGASFNSDAMPVENFDTVSIHLTVAGSSTAVGTIVVQASNDKGDGQRFPTIANWTDLPGLDMTISAATGSPFLTSIPACTYRWLRLKYTRTSGSGTATALLTGKAHG